MRILLTLLSLVLPLPALADGHDRLLDLAGEIRAPGVTDISLVDFTVLRASAERLPTFGNPRQKLFDILNRTILSPTIDPTLLAIMPLDDSVGFDLFDMDTYATWGDPPTANGVIVIEDGLPDVGSVLLDNGLEPRETLGGPIYSRGADGENTPDRDARSPFAMSGEPLRFAPRGTRLFVAYDDASMERHLTVTDQTLADEPGIAEFLAAAAAQSDLGGLAQVYLIRHPTDRRLIYPSAGRRLTENQRFELLDELGLLGPTSPQMPAASITALLEWRDGARRTAAVALRVPSRELAERGATTWNVLKDFQLATLPDLRFREFVVGDPGVRIVEDANGATLFFTYSIVLDADGVGRPSNSGPFARLFDLYRNRDLFILTGRD